MSEKGREMQLRVWGGIVDVLRVNVLQVEGLEAGRRESGA